MSKDSLDKAADAVKGTVDNVRDTVHEAEHRGAAEAEKAKRQTAGDAMTPSEKAGSAINETKHRTLAEVDAAKRDIRNNS